MSSLINKTWTVPIRSLTSLLVVWFLFGGLCLGQTTEQESDIVHIVSDRFEAYQQQQQLIFIGNVVATQGELTIRGERMTIFYVNKKNSEATDVNLAGRIDRVEVDGNVRITQKKILATGEHAVYFGAENKVVLTGQPRVEKGKDFIQGDKITLFLDSEKSVVEGGPSGPVEATIYSSASGGVVD